MIEKTSTKRAPWYLVPTNDKLFGRIAAFKILIDRLGKGVNLKPRPLDPEIAARAAQLFDRLRQGDRIRGCLAATAHDRFWHECDIARSQMDVRFRGKSGRAADITRMTEFDPNRSFEAFRSTCLSALVTDRAMEAWYYSSIP